MAFLPLLVSSQHNSLSHHLPPFAPAPAAATPSHPPANHALFPPTFMDAGPNSNLPPLPTSSSSGQSPSTSNASNLSTTVASAPPPIRKKPGRGPGKKDLKDRPTVSVRWDDGDLTERLIAAVESNERWQGVFAQSSSEPGQVRASAPVAKRDLQREIARHLFQADPRYDLDDRKVLESLAVSVKNKLFKLTTLYAECKQELGQLSTLNDERDLPPGSELANTWARVKEKFPQYVRIRDLMNKVPSSGSEDPLSPVNRPSNSPTLRTRHSTAGPLMSGQVPPNSSSSSSLKGAVDLPRDAQSYMDVSARSGAYINAASGSSMATVTSPTFPMQSPRMQSSSAYGQLPGGQRRMTGSSMPMSASAPSRSNSGMVGMPPVLHQPQPHYMPTQPQSTVQMPRPSPYTRPNIQTSGADLQAQNQLALEKLPTSPSPSEPPSPPLGQTIQSIVTTLTERKDRDRARAHELEVMRMKREEAERVRWHQREMMRLKIQLIRAERNAAGAAMASSTPGAGPSHLGTGGVEDDLALAAGLGDDGMSMEGDGEGELDEEMFDPEPSRSHHRHQHHPANGM